MRDEDKPAIDVTGAVEHLKGALDEVAKVAPQVKKPEDIRRADLRGAAAPLRAAVGRLRTALAQARQEHAAAVTKRHEAVRAVAATRRDRLEKVADLRRAQAEEPQEDGFVVTGRIVDKATGRGLPGVEVRAFDLDRVHDDLVGTCRTDELGFYRVTYRAEDFQDRDVKPEMYIEVLDEDGSPIHTSRKSFVQKSGEVEVIDAEVAGEALSASRAAAETTDGLLSARLVEEKRHAALPLVRRTLERRAPE